MHKQVINQRLLVLAITLIPLILLTWYLQENLFLNWDVGHLLVASESMLSGGQYANDFFMPNPPMILYIYAPVIWLQHLLGMSAIIAFRCYIMTLSLMILIICLMQVNAIIPLKDDKYYFVFSIIFAVTIFILPAYELGQRDCLLYLFAMPYILSVASRLEGKSFNRIGFVLVGILAGVGFAIKPQFILTPIVIESYMIYHHRSPLVSLRPEVIAIGAVLLAHSIVIYIFHQPYYTIIMPFLISHYYASIGAAWRMVLVTNPSALFYLVLLFYGITYGQGRYLYLRKMLMLATVSFFLIYAVQRTQFYYHQVAFFSASLLVLGLLLCDAITQAEYNFKKLICCSILIMCTALYYVYFQNQLWTLIVFDIRVFYASILAILLWIVLLIPKQTSHFRAILSVCCMLPIAYLFSELVRTSELYTHQFSLTLLMILVLLVITASRLKANIFHTALIGTLSAALFSIPCLALYQYYNASLTYRYAVLDKLTDVIKQLPGEQSLYAFSQSTIYSSPLIFYTHARLAQRFDCLWMAIGLAQRVYDQGDVQAREFIRKNHDPYFFINMIAEDFQLKKPKLVIIDNSRINILFKSHGIKPIKSHIDYLSYFLENDKFKQEWSHYHYLTTLESNAYLNYQLLIYQRGA